MHTLWPRREHGKSGALPWHVPAADEPSSLRLWRSFVRVAASHGGGNVHARKKVLDAEAFALEQLNEDIRRLDLPAVFREFMDALTNDYLGLAYQGSGPKPLFLLAVDDADMNPRLSAHLLEVIRTLYHPRLAFLLTGHSALFVEMMKQELIRDVQLDRTGVPTTDQARLETLALEIYAKVIPQGHRCPLPPLPEGERISALPELKDLLGRLPIHSREGEEPRWVLSLQNYLHQGTQVREALPERLRSLWDLYGELALAVERTKQHELQEDPTAAAVESFWQFALRNAPLGPDIVNALQRMVHRTRLLWVEDGFVATPVRQHWSTHRSTQGWQLVLDVPERFRLAFRGKELDPQTTAALILATNFAADDLHGAFRTHSPAIMGLREPVFAHGSGVLVQKGQVVAPWPIPNWGSFEDLYAMKETWELGLIFSGERPTFFDYLARYFLSAVISVGTGPRFKPMQPQPRAEGARTSEPESYDVLLEWPELVNRVAALASRTSESSRQSALSDWALSRAGLMAAPESGLPPSVANQLLHGLRTAFGENWAQAKMKLREARRARLLAIPLNEKVTSDSDSWIDRIDELFSEHEFGSMIEAQQLRRAPDKLLEGFETALNWIRIPWLSHIIGRSRTASLQDYLTPYRRKLLEAAPPAFLRRATETLSSFRPISGEGAPALIALWQVALDWSNADKRLYNAIREEGGSLVINPRLLEGLTRKEQLPTRRRNSGPSIQPVRLWANNDLQTDVTELHAWATSSEEKNLNPMLEVILRMARDYTVDQQGNDMPMLFPKIEPWPGAVFRYGNYEYSPWMVPAWPTLLENELLEPVWNKMVTTVRRTNPSGERGEGAKYVDALAYWLLRSTQDLSSRRSPDEELHVGPNRQDWERATMSLSSRQDSVHQARQSLFDAWLAQLPLMAAPECGLSLAGVNALLGLTQAELEKDPRKRLRLLHMREERLTSSGIPRGEVKEFLHQIDRKQKKHPWVVLMRKPRPPRSGPQKVKRTKPTGH
ncbi:MAG: hypothetical protein JXB05_22480 [Myxococcaceae bacterium]|nr:hypothetical protein [Myxococcaceae bacterium]